MTSVFFADANRLPHTATDCLVMAIDASGLMGNLKLKEIVKLLEKHPVTVGLVMTVLGGAFAFGMWLYEQSKPDPIVEPDNAAVMALFIDSLTNQLDKRTAELSQANVDRGKLQQQIDELQRKLAIPEKALDEALTPNADLGAQLDALRGRYDPNRIAAAKDAMARFDYDAAEAVFQQMRDDTTDAVKLQAAAEFGLGEIADARVDWPAAAQHYDRAADLDPTIETLGKARDFLERNGQYDLA